MQPKKLSSALFGAAADALTLWGVLRVLWGASCRLLQTSQLT
jgi:hypothetical protein